MIEIVDSYAQSRRAWLGRLAGVPLLAGAAAGCGGQAGPAGVAGPVGSAVASGVATPSPALKPPLTYVALGASDAAGVGVEDPARDSWVSVLGRLLPQPARVVNLGIPGITLGEAVQTEVPPALDAKPDLITVWLVVNDVLGGVTLDQYQDALRQLLAQLRASANAYVAVGNVPHAPEASRYLGVSAAERAALAGLWNEVIARVAAEHGATLVDLYARWPLPDHPEYIGPDGLHPTVLGYRTLAETFVNVLREQRIV